MRNPIHPALDWTGPLVVFSFGGTSSPSMTRASVGPVALLEEHGAKAVLAKSCGVRRWGLSWALPVASYIALRETLADAGGMFAHALANQGSVIVLGCPALGGARPVASLTDPFGAIAVPTPGDNDGLFVRATVEDHRAWFMIDGKLHIIVDEDAWQLAGGARNIAYATAGAPKD